MSDQNGLTNSPFANPVVPTPDAGSGFSGTPGGFDLGPGENGLRQTPWDNPVVPTPSGAETPSKDIGTTIRQTPAGDSTHEGEKLEGDIKTGLSSDIARK